LKGLLGIKEHLALGENPHPTWCCHLWTCPWHSAV